MFDGRYDRSSATAWSAAAASRTTSVAAPLWRAWMVAPPSSPLSMVTPVNSATIEGPETNAYASSVMITKSARPMRSAGPETAGPSSTMITGTIPEQSAMARAA